MYSERRPTNGDNQETTRDRSLELSNLISAYKAKYAVLANDVPPSFTEHYAVLGVSRTASKEEVSSASLALLMKLHPDKWQSIESTEHAKLLKSLNAITAQIISAKNLLSNTRQRAGYDIELSFAIDQMSKPLKNWGSSSVHHGYATGREQYRWPNAPDRSAEMELVQELQDAFLPVWMKCFQVDQDHLRSIWRWFNGSKVPCVRVLTSIETAVYKKVTTKEFSFTVAGNFGDVRLTRSLVEMFNTKAPSGFTARAEKHYFVLEYNLS